MKEVYDFLKKAGAYYLATVDGGAPRVRPFGTIDLFENKLYFQTGKSKNVSKQIRANPNIEICALAEDRSWIRLQAQAIEDDRVEARRHMLEAYPALRDRYAEDDGNTQVFRLTGARATIYPVSGAPRTVMF